MLRHRLTDEQWDLIADVFPAPKSTGRPRNDPRVMMDAIFWITNVDAPWRDLPPEFGPWQTAWDYFNRWNSDGTLQIVLDRLQDHVEIDDEMWCVDGTTARAHKCSSGGGKKKMLKSQRIMRWDEAVAV